MPSIERPGSQRSRIRAALRRYGPKMSWREIQAMTGIEEKKLRRTLAHMVEQGCLEKEVKFFLPLET